MQAAKRAVFNTGIIYGKTIITIFISLFSTRLVMNALGANDFGLFNVIGGLISMLSFLNAAMTVSTQRYISFNLGKKDLNKIKRIFANSIVLHFGIALLLLVLFEIVGLYLLNFKLQIDASRITVATGVFHFVVISTFISIISVPYDAVINAHENMTFLAITGILESVLKLIVAYYLFFAMQDKLLVYGFLTMLSTVVIRIIKQIYVRKKYPETHVNYVTEFDTPLIKELTSFASWNLLGSFSYIAKNQGLSIILNLFFGTVVNAAFGIANQVAGQLNFFSSAMLQAVNPQIMKSEGATDRKHMLLLSMTACKLGFLLLAFIAIPCIFEMKIILKMWLKILPEHSVTFCSLILISIMFNQLTIGLDSAIQSTGNIKRYMVVGGTIKILFLPCSYLLLKLNYNINLVFVAYSIFELLGGLVRILILKQQANLSLSSYFKEVIKPILPVSSVVVCFNALSVTFWTYESRWMISIPISIIMFFTITYFTGLSPEEKKLINKLSFGVKNKLIALTHVHS